MKKRKLVMGLVFLTLALILTACGQLPAGNDQAQMPPAGSLGGADSSAVQPTETIADVPQQEADASEDKADSLTREDAQGEVTVIVTPLNLDSSNESIDFEVKLDTHSVDLNMDLSQLAVLTTDTGKNVLPGKWDAPSGGHHVAGTLSFPANMDGTSVLEGAKTLTLTIKNVDVLERTFTWNLETPEE